MNRRSVALALLTASVAATLALPTAAAAKTRWVDDDGKAGPSGCAGLTKAAKLLQPAVTASAAGDVIKVCPGTYLGRVIVTGARTGLTIRAVGGSPKVRLPATVSGTVMIVKAVDDVTLKGLTIETPVADACVDGFRIGVRVTGSVGVALQGLVVRAIGTNTYAGCDLTEGIKSEDSQTTITGGSVTDFTSDGVVAFGDGTLLIDGTTLTFAHAGESTAGAGGTGVSIQTGVTATVRNLIIDGLATAGVSTPLLSVGVDLYGDGSTIENLTVDHVRTGAAIYADDVTVNTLSATSSGTALKLVMGTNADVTAVGTSGTSQGILVTGASDANIHGNSLIGASCEDQTSGTGTAGTKNLWSTTVAASSTPVGICETTPT